MKGDDNMTREEMERIFKAAMHTTPEELQATADLIKYTQDRMAELGETDGSKIAMIAGAVLVYYGKELAAKEGRADK